MLIDIDNIEIAGEAEDYTGAMSAIASIHPDILILDINMPGKSGLDLLTEVKHKPNPPMAIMMSNYSDIHYRALCKKMGADYFFDKTTEFEKIPEVLNAYAKA